jgi:hypothetical protein
MKEIQAKSLSRKNWMVRFWIPEGLIFLEQIESDKGLRFCLFRKDLPVYQPKSYVLLPI